MKWIRKFENKDDLDQLSEYFQELCDNWDIEIEYGESHYSNVHGDLSIEIKIGRNLWRSFPYVQKLYKSFQSVMEYNHIDNYFNFMVDLKKSLDHLISSSEGNYTCNRITQTEYSKLIITIS
jgi:hypothetical protein